MIIPGEIGRPSTIRMVRPHCAKGGWHNNHVLDAKVLCGYRQCVQFFCKNCRRYLMGWGEIGCPCDTGRAGHRTRAEFKRRSVRHLVKRGR